MVCYCCIHGCNNNTNSAKKDFRVISFHSFPSNPALRLKWLKAIGRPNWIPPTYARVCSIHFNDDQINQDGFRSRLKEDAWPVKDLPLHSNFEASHVEVCRICLATDTTMFSLEDELLKICMNSIFAFKERYNMEGFPQFICLECKVILLKCQNLIQKSMTAQATMLDIFSDNGEITKSLVLEIDREKLKLKSSINTYCVTPTHVLEYIYNEDIGSSYLKERYTLGSNEEYQLETDNSTENEYRNDNENQCEKDYRNECNSIIDTVNVEIQTSPYTDEGSADETDGNCTVKQIDFTGIEGTPNITVEYFNQHNTYQGSSDEEESRLQIVIDNADMPTESTSQDTGVTNTVPKTRGYDGLTARELDMQKYFTIVKLSLEEQIMDWNYNADDPQWKSFNSGTSYQCEICLKQFATRNTYNSHMIRHNPSRGSAECPVCRHRFKSDALARAHATRAHSKRFLCKSCPKVFSNVSVATKHSRWHSGYVYRCGRCDFTSAHESALGEHARRRHAESLACACAQCGRTFVSARGLALHATSAHSGVPNSDSCDLYKCEECDINFNSEGARRVHILTSIHHQKKRSLTGAAFSQAEGSPPPSEEEDQLEPTGRFLSHAV